MSEPPAVLAGAGRLERLREDELCRLLVGRRWFAGAGREPASARLAEVVHAERDLELALVEVGFRDGGRSTYLLALGAGGEDALEDAAALRRLLALAGVESACASVRVAGGEQSNTAVVVDERLVLKLYRRIEPGPGIEAELLRALERAGFASAPRLRGVLEHDGLEGRAALALVTEYVPSAGDGWELSLSSLAGGDPGWLPLRARRLGEVTGAMHTALAAPGDAEVAPEPPPPDAVAVLAAALDEEIGALAVSPLAARTGELHDLVHGLASAAELPRLVLRGHGDYHLGQVLWADRGDWVVIDLEGEPGRTLAERRRRTFALRDVAGMLRSFAYAADASALLNGVTAPEGWEASCRDAFLEGWRAAADPRLLPASEAGCERLLVLCELQKLLYELRYELRHRPDWARLPAAGLERILEST